MVDPFIKIKTTLTPPPFLIYTQLMWPIFKNKYQHFIVLLILTNKGSNSKYLNTRKCIFTWMKEEKSLFDVCIWKWVCMQFCLFPNSNCGIFKQRPFKNYIHRPYATLSFWQLIKSYTCTYNYAVNIPLDSAFHSQSYIYKASMHHACSHILLLIIVFLW